MSSMLKLLVCVLEKLPTELRHTLHRNFIPYQEVLPQFGSSIIRTSVVQADTYWSYI